jgi:hypothetical protein
LEKEVEDEVCPIANRTLNGAPDQVRCKLARDDDPSINSGQYKSQAHKKRCAICPHLLGKSRFTDILKYCNPSIVCMF